MQNKDSKRLSFKRELARKLTHLTAFVIPGVYIFVPMSKDVMLTVMIPVAVCMIIIDIARLRDWRLWHVLRRLISPMIRETEERGDFTGATYILTTACVVIAFFSRPVASLALAFIIVGDPAAALIGQRFGKRRFRNKSLEGSLAFLTAALIITIITPQLPLAVRVVGAFVATVTEAVSFKVDDNTTVPLVSGLIMTLLLRLVP